ncbi:MAG: Panacea domain-containing protein [Thermodesulfobacteriota bacterium]
MGNKILYQMDYEKAIEAMVWLANKNPFIDIYHVAKILYYAEKTHLNKYGRPLIGATYIRMPYGQVPSEIRDIINNNTWMVEPEYLERFCASIKVMEGRYPKLTSLREPDTDYFSETDIQCLQESLDKYKDLSFDELKRISHEERSYKETEPKEKIDYLLMVDEENENKDEIIEDIQSTSQYVRF